MSVARDRHPAPQAETPAQARADLMARLRRAGPPALDDAEALALISGASAAQVAALLDRFGSLPEVLAAPPAALQRFAPAAAACRLALAHDLARRMLEQPLRRRLSLSSSSDVERYLRAVLAGLPREQFRVLFLDRKNQLIRDELMAEGTVDHAPVYPREVVRRALELDASAMILAHNHPSGDAAPSAADAEMTRQVVAAARALGLVVHDHLVVGGQEVVSLRALGRM